MRRLGSRGLRSTEITTPTHSTHCTALLPRMDVRQPTWPLGCTSRRRLELNWAARSFASQAGGHGRVREQTEGRRGEGMHACEATCKAHMLGLMEALHLIDSAWRASIGLTY